jgi:hypothetical protein
MLPIPFSPLPPMAEARIQAELKPEERLLWAGVGDEPSLIEPVGFVVALVLDLMAWGVGLGILYRSAQTDVIEAGRPSENALLVVGTLALIVAFGITLGLIGFGTSELIGGWRRRRSGRMSLFALTDRRAVMWLESPLHDGMTVSSLGRGQVTHVRRVERTDGRWNLEFTLTLPHYTGPHRFEGIPAEPRIEALARGVLVCDSGRDGPLDSSPSLFSEPLPS